MASSPALLRLPSPSPSTILQKKSSAPVIPFSTPRSHRYFPVSTHLHLHLHRPKSALQEAASSSSAALEEEEVPAVVEGDDQVQGVRLFVANFPFPFTASDMEALFSQCSATVKDVQFANDRSGRCKGFAFVTVDSEESARAIIEKFDTYVLNDRVIRVNYATTKFVPPPKPKEPAPVETRFMVFVYNLAWKVRRVDLREFFSAFNPTSCKVVFKSPSGPTTGFGFVSFNTEEEALAAIAELDGKELMGRPIRAKVHEKREKVNPEGKAESVESSDDSTTEVEPVESSDD